VVEVFHLSPLAVELCTAFPLHQVFSVHLFATTWGSSVWKNVAVAANAFHYVLLLAFHFLCFFLDFLLGGPSGWPPKFGQFLRREHIV
jgi:hypothetical protein